jgi:hypothetical protein
MRSESRIDIETKDVNEMRSRMGGGVIENNERAIPAENRIPL